MDKHTKIRIILGAIVEYTAMILGAIKILQLLNRLFAWCVEGVANTAMVSLGMAVIVLMILTAILHERNHEEDSTEDEFYEKFGGNED